MSSVVAASFNVSVGGYLQSFLDQNTSSQNANTSLFGVIGSGGSTSGQSGVFGLLQTNGTSAAGATAAALSRGQLTTGQQKIVAAVGNAPNGVLTEGWNTNRTEPSALTQLRSYGWIKLTSRTFDASTKTFQGNYTLTPIGQEIYQRTNGGAVGTSASTPLSASTLNGGTATTGATGLSSSQSAAIVSILTSLGLATTTSTPTVGGVPTGSSSNTTGSVVNLVA